MEAVQSSSNPSLGLPGVTQLDSVFSTIVFSNVTLFYLVLFVMGFRPLDFVFDIL